MPELTVTLNEALTERVLDAAVRRGLSPREIVEVLLDEYLPEPVPEAVGQISPRKESLSRLVALLGSPQPEERYWAKTKLIEHGYAAHRSLREGMKTDNPDQAHGIAEILARTSSSEVVELLLNFRHRAPQEARAGIDRELRVCLERYGMSPQESHVLLDRCRWQLVPLVARWLNDSLCLGVGTQNSLTAEEIEKRFDTPPTEDDIHTLLILLQRARTENMAVALIVAQLLQFVARTAPTPSLRKALRLLRPSWRQPFPPSEFTSTALIIEKMISQRKNLPLPAEAGDDFENRDLPVPVDNSG